MTIKHQRWNIDIDEHYMRYETNNSDFVWCFYRMFELCEEHGIIQSHDLEFAWPGILTYTEFPVEYWNPATEKTWPEQVGSLLFNNTFVFEIADALAGASSPCTE